jgi:hypothetical protein
MVTLLLTSLSQFVHLFLPGKLPLEFHMCAGSDPDEGGFLPRRNIPLVFVYGLSLLINIALTIRIRLYQIKYDKRDNDKSYSFNLTDLTTGLTVIVCVSLSTSSLLIQYSIVPANMNVYPYYILVQFIQLFLPTFVTSLVMLMYFYRNKVIRTTIWRSLKEWKSAL